MECVLLNWKIFGLLRYVYFEFFLQTWRTVVDYAGVYTVTVYVKYGLQLTKPVADPEGVPWEYVQHPKFPRLKFHVLR